MKVYIRTNNLSDELLSSESAAFLFYRRGVVG